MTKSHHNFRCLLSGKMRRTLFMIQESKVNLLLLLLRVERLETIVLVGREKLQIMQTCTMTPPVCKVSKNRTIIISRYSGDAPVTRGRETLFKDSTCQPKITMMIKVIKIILLSSWTQEEED